MTQAKSAFGMAAMQCSYTENELADVALRATATTLDERGGIGSVEVNTQGSLVSQPIPSRRRTK